MSRTIREKLPFPSVTGHRPKVTFVTDPNMQEPVRLVRMLRKYLLGPARKLIAVANPTQSVAVRVDFIRVTFLILPQEAEEV